VWPFVLHWVEWSYHYCQYFHCDLCVDMSKIPLIIFWKSKTSNANKILHLSWWLSRIFLCRKSITFLAWARFAEKTFWHGTWIACWKCTQKNITYFHGRGAFQLSTCISSCLFFIAQIVQCRIYLSTIHCLYCCLIIFIAADATETLFSRVKLINNLASTKFK